MVSLPSDSMATSFARLKIEQEIDDLSVDVRKPPQIGSAAVPSTQNYDAKLWKNMSAASSSNPVLSSTLADDPTYQMELQAATQNVERLRLLDPPSDPKSRSEKNPAPAPSEPSVSVPRPSTACAEKKKPVRPRSRSVRSETSEESFPEHLAHYPGGSYTSFEDDFDVSSRNSSFGTGLNNASTRFGRLSPMLLPYVAPLVQTEQARERDNYVPPRLPSTSYGLQDPGVLLSGRAATHHHMVPPFMQGEYANLAQFELLDPPSSNQDILSRYRDNDLALELDSLLLPENSGTDGNFPAYEEDPFGFDSFERQF